ncbi:uncharacterized protein LOC144105097 isoform X2 [Amblyomma americanum]
MYGFDRTRWTAVPTRLGKLTAFIASRDARQKKLEPDLNWTTCPSENELRAQQHFAQLDEKLAQQLRTSAGSPPRTENESWHAVTPDIHVFSAFLVTTQEYAIHIISLVRDRMNENYSLNPHPPLVCLVRSSRGTREYTARIEQVWTWLNPTYKNAFILCPPPEQTIISTGNIQVAVTVRGAVNSTLRWLELHIPSDKLDEKCCAVCVRPVFGSSLSLSKLVEFVAHYRVIGARRFYFYDLEMTPDVKILLGKLQAAGIAITLVPFRLLVNSSEVHAEGQMPGLYDCIFRSMSRTEYFIHVDFDELIMPAGNSSISAVVQEVEQQEGKAAIGSIVIKSRYYCAEYPIDSSHWTDSDVPLQTRTFTYRSRDLDKEGFTKYIGRSRAVCNAAVHTVLTHCGIASEIRLEASLAVINHYRRCCAFTEESPVIYLKIPLWNASYVIAHDPPKEYTAGIETDLAIRTLTSLLPGV